MEKSAGSECKQRVQKLEQKLNSENTLTQEMEDELAKACAKILNLEAQVKHLARPEHTQMVDLLVKDVKQEAGQELFQYQRDTEAKFSQEVRPCIIIIAAATTIITVASPLPPSPHDSSIE